ncbi:MAG: type II secretion system protein [Rickettsiales bacterium]
MQNSHQGFSLVELSIVLVILGLLVGGILSGQSLIRASQLRGITTEQQRHFAAIHTFRDKYFMLPGDMNNATSFWGKDNVNCAAHTGTVATPGTCNGDADGQFDMWDENYRLWQHLANAGLIEGSFLGYVSPATSATTPTIASQVPTSKVSSNAYWTAAYISQLGTINHEFGYAAVPDIRSNYVLLSNRSSGWWLNPNVLKPEEAWNIDTKTDDGKPFTGSVRSSNWNSAVASCLESNTATSNYNLTSSTNLCPLGFILN